MTFYVFFSNDVSKSRKKSEKSTKFAMSIEILASKLPEVMDGCVVLFIGEVHRCTKISL